MIVLSTDIEQIYHITLKLWMDGHATITTTTPIPLAYEKFVKFCVSAVKLVTFNPCLRNVIQITEHLRIKKKKSK